jgi:hypothetical protein
MNNDNHTFNDLMEAKTKQTQPARRLLMNDMSANYLLKKQTWKNRNCWNSLHNSNNSNNRMMNRLFKSCSFITSNDDK